MTNAWRRSDLSHVGLGRGLVYGERPNHAALSMLDDGYIVTDATGTTFGLDVEAWCEHTARPMPEAADLAWMRGGK